MEPSPGALVDWRMEGLDQRSVDQHQPEKRTSVMRESAGSLPRIVVSLTLFTSMRALEVVFEARKELVEEFGIYIDFEIDNSSLVGISNYDIDNLDAVVWFGDKRIDIMQHIEYDDEYYNNIKNTIIMSVIETLIRVTKKGTDSTVLLSSSKKRPTMLGLVIAS